MKVFEYDREDTILTLGNDHPLSSNIESGSCRDELSHYTSVEAFEYIASSRYWRFTRIDKSNDLLEAKYIIGEDKPENEKLLNLLYAASFVHETEDTDGNENGTLPMWLIYTQHDRGIKLKLRRKNKEQPIATLLFDANRKILSYFKSGYYIAPQQNNSDATNNKIVLEQVDILYNDGEEVRKITSPNLLGADRCNTSIAGRYKNKHWSYENETRMITKFSLTGKCQLSEADYLLIPVKFDSLSLEIMFNPWMSQEDKEKIRSICKMHLLDITYECRDCGLEGVVKRKR